MNGSARPLTAGAQFPISTMPLRLRDNLHWCACSGRVVFLDVSADRYFCLPVRANDAFIRLARGEAGSLDAEPLGMLRRRGVLVSGGSPGAFRQPAAIERPLRDILQGAVPLSGFGPVLRALSWEARAAWQMRSRGFCKVVASAARPRPYRCAMSRDSEPAAQSIAAAAEAVAFLTRSHNRCLVRAFAVHSACRARSIPAKLVIGVIAHPFAAHSWVQLGDAVVIGGYEQARLYTPILVIE